jgi:hypothetical protein
VCGRHAASRARAGHQDTSRQGRYHNARFKALGEELGLVISRVHSIGWSGTKLAPCRAGEYADELAELATALVAYRHHEGGVLGPGGPGSGGGGTTAGGKKGGAGEAVKNGIVLVCECDKPRKVLASTAVVVLGPILCALCDAEFAPV